jgi:DNA modification methylase
MTKSKQETMLKPEKKNQGPVTCLGMNFENDEQRLEYFTNLLREKLKEPEFREIEGFPNGEDEDILALSDPPYYTACPNLFIEDWIETIDNDCSKEYNKTPYTGDLKTSTRHPVYSYHPYHTKVPPEIIKSLIKHYTDENDIVFDGFSGSGMTGVAARECNRNVILIDLCPVSTFISRINNTSHDYEYAISLLENIIAKSKNRYNHYYTTIADSQALRVNYFVLSDVFNCPNCAMEFPFFKYGVIHHGNKVETKKIFNCPECSKELNVRTVERIITAEGKKKQLVWINAGKGKNRINRTPNNHDLELVKIIEKSEIINWYPDNTIDPDGYSAKLAQLGNKSITDISQFLSKRNRIIFSDLWNRISHIKETEVRNLCYSTLTSIFTVISERQGYFGGGGGMSGNLYMPIIRMEKNIYDSLSRKIEKLKSAELKKANLLNNTFISTQSSTALKNIKNNSIDYIYTDPPFGSNIIYSEMNLILEGWLKVTTNDGSEAVIDETKDKLFVEYAELMKNCFIEFHRILKPGHWMTVEFHNTQASIWNLIQNSLGESGFIVAQVNVFDKGSTTILADIRPGAAKNDLIISCYKPAEEFSEKFTIDSGTEEGAWDFIMSHLKQLPIAVLQNGKIDIITERLDYLLFDRMVAFYVQRGISISISASEFYIGLRDRYPERDGMFFLPEQLAEYEKTRMTVSEVVQMTLFVVDEKSAIQWLRNRLEKNPSTYQDLHPEFLQELHQVKHEKMPELMTILEQNYLKDNKDRWYVPDIVRAEDLEKIREKHLLREFWTYLPKDYKPQLETMQLSLMGNGDRPTAGLSGEKIKITRTEAIRVGFKTCWSERDYRTIIVVAERLQNSIIQEDPDLLMYYDNALTRVGD